MSRRSRPTDADLRALDPTRQAPLSRVGQTSAQALLQCVRATPLTTEAPTTEAPTTEATSREQDRARRRWQGLRWPVAAAAAVTVAAAIVLVPNGGDRVAFASWTAVPAGVPAADIEAAGDACRRNWQANAESGPRSGMIPTREDWAAMPTVLAEQRGDYTYTVLTNGRWIADCLLRDDELAGGFWAGIGVQGPDSLVPAPDGVVSLQSGTVKTSEGYYNALNGRVGRDVTAVQVTTADGTTIDASIANGHFAVWWPGARASDLTLTIHRSNGTTIEGIPAEPLLGHGVVD